MDQQNPNNVTNFGAAPPLGTTSATDTGSCAHCGQPLGGGSSRGIEEFLGRLGISEEMVNNLKTSMQKVDIEEYLNTAREYVKSGGDKAAKFSKDNPGKVAAGVALLSFGAGLLLNAIAHREQ